MVCLQDTTEVYEYKIRACVLTLLISHHIDVVIGCVIELSSRPSTSNSNNYYSSLLDYPIPSVNRQSHCLFSITHPIDSSISILLLVVQSLCSIAVSFSFRKKCSGDDFGFKIVLVGVNIVL